MAQDHRELLEEGEWIWADSAYPVRVGEPHCHSTDDTADRFMTGSSHRTRNLTGIFLEMKNSTTTCRWCESVLSMPSGSSRAASIP